MLELVIITVIRNVTTDGNVLGMATVVYAPPAVSTAANVNL